MSSKKRLSNSKNIYYKGKNSSKSFLHSIDPDIKEIKVNFNGKNHNLPVLNMIVEIPKNTNKKMEISVEKDYNPIIQDIKNGKPRTVPSEKLTNLRNYTKKLDSVKEYYMKDIWPVGSKGYSLFSYGAIPQTFEDASRKESLKSYDKSYHNNLKYKGDGDPLDILLINDKQKRKIGQVVRVIIIGIFPMIDDNEIDWKVIGIPFPRRKSSSRLKINIPDSKLELYRLWFQHYKDKVLNNQLISGGVQISHNMGHKIAYKVIIHCQKQYQEIIQGKHNNNSKNMGLYNSFQVLE